MVSPRGPDPSKGVFLTNGDLTGAPTSFGFDWHGVYPDVVQFTYARGEPSYTFEFDGREPENCEILFQTMPLPGGKPYRFTARFRSNADPQASGLRWTLHDHKTGQLFDGRATVSSVGSSPSDNTEAVAVDFAAPPSTDSADLRLEYHRQPGTRVFNGTYELLKADVRLR